MLFQIVIMIRPSDQFSFFRVFIHCTKQKKLFRWRNRSRLNFITLTHIGIKLNTWKDENLWIQQVYHV